MPACLRTAAAVPPSPSESGPTITTSAYETPLGVAALSWSRTLFGLSVRADLRLNFNDDVDDISDNHLSFRIRPWFLFSRRGSKRFSHMSHTCEFAWDLSRAKFAGGPEPISGFYVSISVDGEILLIAGDLLDAAFKRLKKKKRDVNFFLISRKEHVMMKDDSCYETKVRFGGKDRVISIDLNGEMSLEVDGKPILQIRRLRWKFRGSEMVKLEGGDRIQISWDLHKWLFQTGGDQNAGNSNCSNALFVFRFESGEGQGVHGHFGKGVEEGYFGNSVSKNWSDTSSNGKSEKGKNVKGRSNKTKKKSLVKTSSSSSASSTASSVSSSVMEWASPEENELRNKVGFSLLISAWRR